MGSTNVLADEFAGDQAWDEFVEAVQLEKLNEFVVGRLFDVLADEKISSVLASVMGQQAEAWLLSPCRALENQSPIAVFRNEKFGPKIIKSLLMRIP